TILEQDARALIVDIEKRLEIGKLIRLAHFIRSFERQRDPISRSQLKHQLWFERAFDVEMQFGLRHPFDKALHTSSFFKDTPVHPILGVRAKVGLNGDY